MPTQMLQVVAAGAAMAATVISWSARTDATLFIFQTSIMDVATRRVQPTERSRYCQ